MGLADKDLKTANINTFQDLKGGISLMKRGMTAFKKMGFLEMKQYLKWKISLEEINNCVGTEKGKEKNPLKLEAE